ncbi:hypothetical protein NIBR502772_05875 [Pseudarthrobacter sp. NIBRBAC000502772]|uniref:hypothetical protein n=1 Tax=Pseudarthrobacter sp. NIBRBAC000502772 TaxID=2590775 RepID=UPI0011320BEE|nr:hypothetical protein [Pseudarthrobacter sp. NIBRBAC000502772]QDG65802.1 hypothetical protein NIBR502772_05875 [Pseudarthrobacter sp. NIBRBAC000502772]
MNQDKPNDGGRAMDLSAEYAAALDHLGEKRAEFDFLKDAHNALLDNPSAADANLAAARRLMDVAWKASFAAARAKEEAEMKLNLEWAATR